MILRCENDLSTDCDSTAVVHPLATTPPLFYYYSSACLGRQGHFVHSSQADCIKRGYLAAVGEGGMFSANQLLSSWEWIGIGRPLCSMFLTHLKPVPEPGETSSPTYFFIFMAFVSADIPPWLQFMLFSP